MRSTALLVTCAYLLLPALLRPGKLRAHNDIIVIAAAMMMMSPCALGLGTNSGRIVGGAEPRPLK